jgi:hypothetical protein
MAKIPDRTDGLVRLLGCLLVAVLGLQLKTIGDRVATLERNQVRLMVSLGVAPVALEAPDTTDSGVNTARFSPCAGNR